MKKVLCMYVAEVNWRFSGTFVCDLTKLVNNQPVCLHRRPDQRQWSFHIRGAGSRGQVSQHGQLGLLPVFPQQPAVPVVTATLRHVGRDALGPKPPAGGLQEQPLPQPAASRHRRPHHGVQPGPARQQVTKRRLFVSKYLQKNNFPSPWSKTQKEKQAWTQTFNFLAVVSQTDLKSGQFNVLQMMWCFWVLLIFTG